MGGYRASIGQERKEGARHANLSRRKDRPILVPRSSQRSRWGADAGSTPPAWLGWEGSDTIRADSHSAPFSDEKLAMKTAEVVETNKGQAIQLPDEFRFHTSRVSV